MAPTWKPGLSCPYLCQRFPTQLFQPLLDVLLGPAQLCPLAQLCPSITHVANSW